MRLPTASRLGVRILGQAAAFGKANDRERFRLLAESEKLRTRQLDKK